MRPTKILLSLLGCLALIVLPACQFHKSITNDWIRHLDPSAIEVGKTTQIEVLENFGCPTPVFTTEKALKNVSDRHFVYSCFESREVELLLAYYLILPFKWEDERSVEDLVVEFDERGVVSDFYRVRENCIWRPLQGEGSREPIDLEHLGGRAHR